MEAYPGVSVELSWKTDRARLGIPFLLLLLAALPARAAETPAPTAEPAVSAAVADYETEMKRTLCLTQSTALIADWAPEKPWIRAMSNMDGAQVFRAPTKKVGTWVEVQIFPDHSVDALLVSAAATSITQWKGEECIPRIQVKQRQYDAEVMKKAFTDADLAAVVDTGATGVVYSWSPHMPLSVQGYNEARRAAIKHHLKFIPVLDPQASMPDAEKAARAGHFDKMAMKRMESLDLIFRGMTNHFPGLVVFSKGKLVGPVIPGFAQAARYERFILEQAKK